MDKEDVAEVVKATGVGNYGGCTGRGWKPGQSGNPKGRPKNQFSFASQFRKSFALKASVFKTFHDKAVEFGLDPEVVTIGEVYALNLMESSLTGRDSITKELIKRIDGKIPDVVYQEIITSSVSKLTDKQILKLAQNAMKEIKDKDDDDGS